MPVWKTMVCLNPLNFEEPLMGAADILNLPRPSVEPATAESPRTLANVKPNDNK
jgi:hypothetical protein